MILHGIEYQRPTSLNMRILADHVTYSFLAFMKSIFHFCLGCYCGGYSQNGRSNLSSWPLDSWEHISVKFEFEFYHFHSGKYIWKCLLPKWQPFCSGQMTFYCLVTNQWNKLYFLKSSKDKYGIVGDRWTRHYNDVITSLMVSQITSLTIVYSTIFSDSDQRKHQSSSSLAFVREIYQWLVNSSHKWPVTRKMFPFDYVFMPDYLPV